MQFTYHESANENILTIENDNFKHLIKARRHKVSDEIAFRNLKDNNLYFYKIVSIDRRSATLRLESKKEYIVKLDKHLHIAWCIVDPKTIEKELPYLNELGVNKITFIPCDYSQNNFKLNFEKMEKILINSSQQCGRSDIIKLELAKCLDDFIKENPNTYMLNFSKNSVDSKKDDIKTIIIGCEGGFSSSEIDKFDKEKIVGFNTKLILKSQTAITAVAAKILI
ncbi:16S rRNA (uracil(1498)-N(3))-methyltransferase [Malaciobacter canalis]|uniref:Ribosomal RNA small subunit methyltransferase E n=1 Tax=Malaciobacter canalis TaxID=1912871 RepID=A0ABX4LR92_9BACT|nr:16S rRNA (uracil(1498)-N(3))-methyltransferase [Malaciobacter canalis]PHO10479.1 16S rRNA (uracil(1498)-N(3))-methyltransferase [Malaciobacter canalis]QEE31922.1 16S rRNA m3U1498 methyltransferase [Malaciobacter canalis]